MNLKDFKDHIVLDYIPSWPKELPSLIEHSKEKLKSFLNEERRRDIRREDNYRYRVHLAENEFRGGWNSILAKTEIILSNKKIIGFHCTRLMDSEIDEVIDIGLVPLNSDFSNQRIIKLYNNGVIRRELMEKLINKEEFKDENREGNICFFHCLSTLQNEGGLNRFFKSWGGEAIYLGFEQNTILQKIGIPCIVVGSLDISDLSVYPSLSKRIVCFYLNDSYYPTDFDSFIRKNVKVIEIIKRGDSRFSSLTHIDNWDEKIE